MPDFEKLEQEAQQQARDHSQQVDDAISHGEQDAERGAGQGHDSEFEEAGTALEKELGTEQDQPPPSQP